MADKKLSIITIMGVSGVGKSTVGMMLASALSWGFSDADSFHPAANIEKMHRGIPLSDADRMPWLLIMQEAIDLWLKEGTKMVLACSALKRTYREILLRDPKRMEIVYLQGNFELIQNRLATRQNHFMNKKLLQSQFDTLEEPEGAIYADASQPPEAIVQEIRKILSV